MKMIHIILSLTLLFAGISTGDEITVINDGDYFAALHDELLQAKKSIYAELFLIRPSSNKKDDPTWTLLEDLAEAQKRGLRVDALLEISRWENPNQEAYSFLISNRTKP